MWITLNQGQNVSFGDKLRYTGKYSQFHCHKNVFEVVKTDQHYFVVAPITEAYNSASEIVMRVIKYFDIDDYIKLEVWRKE